MRILMLAQFYSPAIGGEEQHVRTLSQALAKRGHRVAVATLWHEGLPLVEEDGEVRVYRIPSTIGRAQFLFSDSTRRHASPFPDPESMRGIRQIIERERPAIVHAHNWLVHSFVPLKRWSGAKLVMTLHDYSFTCAQKRLIYRNETPCAGATALKCLRCGCAHYGAAKGLATVLGNWTASSFERQAVDCFIAVSDATAAGNRLVEKGISYEVVPNFVDDESDGNSPDVGPFLDKLPDGDFMLFVGEVERYKGVETLLQAYSQLHNPPPLALVGRLSDRSPVHLPAGARSVGSFPHQAVVHAWRRSLFGLVPSECRETFGLVALEAMSAGRPVIASRIGGLPEVVVDGETGFLIQPGDATALAQAINRLTADEHLRKRMGRAALARAAEFHTNRLVPRIEEIYCRLLGIHTGGRARATADAHRADHARIGIR